MDPRATVLVVIPALLLAGCAVDPAAETEFTPTDATRAPVEDVWPRALDLARDWHADARLVGAEDGGSGILSIPYGDGAPRVPFDGQADTWAFTFVAPDGDRSLRISVAANGTLLMRMDVWVSEHLEHEGVFIHHDVDGPPTDSAWLNSTRLMEALAANGTLARFVDRDAAYVRYDFLAAAPGRDPTEMQPWDDERPMDDAPRAPVWHVRAEVDNTWVTGIVDPETWTVVEADVSDAFRMHEPPEWDAESGWCESDADNNTRCGWDNDTGPRPEPVEQPPEDYEGRGSGEVPTDGTFTWSFPVEPWERFEAVVAVDWDPIPTDALRLEVYDAEDHLVAGGTGTSGFDVAATDGVPGDWTVIVSHAGVARPVDVTVHAFVDYW